MTELFPPAVRKAIVGTKIDGLICRADGIGYADGALWAALTHQEGVERYLIASVNPATRSRDNAGRINFLCRTAAERLVVDTDAKGTTRLRVWKRPRAVTDPPDVQLQHGVAKLRGHPRMWTLDLVIRSRCREILRQRVGLCWRFRSAA